MEDGIAGCKVQILRTILLSSMDLLPFSRLTRGILISEYLVKEWARHFKGKSKEELDEIAKSFLFENCLKREGLNKALSKHAEQLVEILGN